MPRSSLKPDTKFCRHPLVNTSAVSRNIFFIVFQRFSGSIFFWILCALSCFIHTIGHIQASILVAKIPMCHSEIRTLDLPILCPMLYSFATKHSKRIAPLIMTLLSPSAHMIGLNDIRQSRQRAVRAICTWPGQRLKSSNYANLSVILDQHR